MDYRALSLHYCSVFVLLAVAATTLFSPLGVAAIATEAQTRTIAISGGNGVFSVDNEVVLPIYINTDEALSPINAFEIEIIADPEAIAINRLYIRNDHCEDRFVINEVLDTAAGIAYKACGTVSPAAATTTLLIGHLQVTPLRAGTTTIVFGAHTNAYAHDGLGTQLIGTTHDLTLNIQ